MYNWSVITGKISNFTLCIAIVMGVAHEQLLSPYFCRDKFMSPNFARQTSDILVGQWSAGNDKMETDTDDKIFANCERRGVGFQAFSILHNVTLSVASNSPTHPIQDCLHHIQDHPHHSACLSELCSWTLHSIRTLRSSDTNLLSVPRVRTFWL